MSFAIKPSQTLVSMQRVHLPKEEEEEEDEEQSSSEGETKNKSENKSENKSVRPSMGAQTSTTLKISGSSTSIYDFS